MGETAAIYVPASLEGPLRQGEIVSGLTQTRLALASLVKGQAIEVEHITHPWAIILSQDCDLDWDFHARQADGSPGKLLPNVLLCEVIDAESLRGTEGINSRVWDAIKKNKSERYHFLQKVLREQDSLQAGLPELGIDFKRYFTIPTDEVYHRLTVGEAQRRCCLESPYLEHLSTRCFYYQSRIALPAEHFSE